MGNQNANTPSEGRDPKTNWPKVAAILSAAASTVAVLSWLGISGNRSPGAHPAATSNPGANTPPDPTTTQTATHVTNSPNPDDTATNFASPTAAPAACTQVDTVVTTFYSDVGTTRYSEIQAAERALTELAQIEAGESQLTAATSADLQAVDNDFQQLYGEVGNSAFYSQALAQLNIDYRHFQSDCGSS